MDAVAIASDAARRVRRLFESVTRGPRHRQHRRFWRRSSVKPTNITIVTVWRGHNPLMNPLDLPANIGRVLTDPADTAPFLVDWRRRYLGRARAVVQPSSAEEVAALLRWCAAGRVPLVPQGGNTGLTGGSVPDDSGEAIVLSLARMNRIRALDTVNNTVTVEAGIREGVQADVVRQAVVAELDKAGLEKIRKALEG